MNVFLYLLYILLYIICICISVISAGFIGVDYIFLNHKYIPQKYFLVSLIIPAIFYILYYVFKRAYQKKRDIVEYNSNGISKAYGNFSYLSDAERKQIEQQKLLKRELLIDSITLKNITKQGALNPLNDLDNMIGLNNIKTEVHKMASRMEFNKKYIKKNKNSNTNSSNHMVFYGNAGTGKTQMASIMTGFLFKNKLIRKNKYISVDGNFFNGNTNGESTEKAKYILNLARGGVLFIDEAYALLNQYEGQEVIATLIAEMENNRDDIVIIFAGYKKEMLRLINSNTGFQSRIKYYFDFNDYTLDELYQIFIKMAQIKGFSITNTDDFKNKFFSIMLNEMKKPNYGNARTVRNVLDKTIDNHSVNYIDNHLSKSDRFLLSIMDLPNIEGFSISTIKI